MGDPFYNSVSKILADLGRDEDIRRTALSRMSPDRTLAQADLIRQVYPSFSAMKKFAEIAGIDRASALAGAAEGAGVLNSRANSVDRAILKVLADSERLNEPWRRSMLPHLHLTESLTRAFAEATRQRTPGIADALSGLAPMQEAAARSLGMRAMIEESIGTTLVQPYDHALLAGLTDLTEASADLWDGLADDGADLVAVPELIRQSPVTQVFNATQSTAMLFVEDPDLVEPPVGLIAAEAGEIEARLREINPALVEQYRGAVETFERRGNDYIRHVSASLRELIKHLLEDLAPTAEIEAWDASVLPEKGKVTYKARLKYIFRGSASFDGFGTMTEKDIEHVLQSFFPLDEGVHRLDPNWEHERLRALLRRCEFDILTILHAYAISSAQS